MALLFILIAVTVLQRTISLETCPAAYARYSEDHSFCKPPNPTCNVIKRGIQNQEKEFILKTHNQFRSKMATGQETRGGGFPQASNMMQMEWDDELAAVAQKWAEQCVFRHDCNECRAVDNFEVGQNIGYQDRTGGTGNFAADDVKQDWYKMLKDLYDEVDDCDESLVASFHNIPGVKIGHFTQIIWADTWRVGCGYIAFKYGVSTIRQLYVCNYGPGGNVKGHSIYEAGKSCTGCPINSCCDDTCKDTRNTYPGLCKMLNDKEAPEYKESKLDMLFNCNFFKGNPDCLANYDKRWMVKHTLSGSILTITLQGGETSTAKFVSPIAPETGDFCLVFQYRKGPELDGQEDSSSLVVYLYPEKLQPMTMELDMSENSFNKYSLGLSGMKNTRFSVNFTVPEGMPAQILDIKEIVAYEGDCEDT